CREAATVDGTNLGSAAGQFQTWREFDMKQVGVIGLGNMGLPMAKNLLRKGYQVYAYDINGSQAESAVREGAIAADSVRKLCSMSEVIVLRLPNSPVLQAVVTGTDGMTSEDLTGKTISDTA